MIRSRTPKWSKWRFVPEVHLWEGVALSLNVEPDSVEHGPHGWMVGAHLFEESEEFDDRLMVATRNLHTNLQPVRVEIVEPADCRVWLSEFAAWAISVEWKIPPELQQLAVFTPDDLMPKYSTGGVYPGGITAVDKEFDPRLRDSPEQSDAAPSSSTSAETRRLATLQKLVLAMAKAKYGWRSGDRNAATGEKAGSIHADVIAQLGEGRRVEADTIRAALEDADRAFPGK